MNHEAGAVGRLESKRQAHAAGTRALLRTSEDLGYRALWYPEAVGYEALSSAGFMLARFTTLSIGGSIVGIYARDAMLATMVDL